MHFLAVAARWCDDLSAPLRAGNSLQRQLAEQARDLTYYQRWHAKGCLMFRSGLDNTPEVARRRFGRSSGGSSPGARGGGVQGKEKRRGPRRRSLADRSAALQLAASSRRSWLPARWPYLILTMLAAIASAIVATKEVPEPLVGGMLVAAVLGVSLVGPAQALAARKARGSRLAAVAAVVVLPLFLFGFGVNRWTVAGGLPWDVAIASLLCVAGVAAAYLRTQPGVIFAAQLSVWSAAVMTHASLAGGITILVALAVAVLVSREQHREQRLEEERRRARARIQTRARDILADYEETRQGWFWETDRRGLMTYVSAPVADALGHAPETLIGRPLVELFDLADTGHEGERTLMFHFTARSAFQELPVRAAIQGEKRWWSVSGRPIHDEFG